MNGLALINIIDSAKAEGLMHPDNAPRIAGIHKPDAEGTITLHKTPSGWFATFGGAIGKTVHAAFGTATIPTAYTAKAPERVVVEAMGILNPGITITVQS